MWAASIGLSLRLHIESQRNIKAIIIYCLAFPAGHHASDHETYRVNPRHGVSCVRSGQRHTLGVIFS